MMNLRDGPRSPNRSALGGVIIVGILALCCSGTALTMMWMWVTNK